MKHLLLLLCFIPLMLFATDNYPVKEINNKRYYEYTVQPGDGLFGIARKFNITQAQLHSANPQLDQGLRAGQIILVPIIEPVAESQEDVLLHTVEPKQTLFAISRKYHVTVDELLSLNPEAVNGIKVGEVLTIRKGKTTKTSETVSTPVKADCKVEPVKVENDEAQNYVVHKVQRRETLYSISKQYQVPIHDILAINPGAESGIRTEQELYIPMGGAPISKSTLLPTETESAATAATTTTQPSVTDIVPTLTDDFIPHSDLLNVSILLPFQADTRNVDGSADRFIEFYKGILLALEKLKQEGMKVVVNTYDVGKHQSGVDSVLRLPQFASTNLIIGPAYTVQVPAVSAYALQHHVMAIVPFTSKISEQDNHPYIYQFNPSQEILFPLIGDGMLKRGFKNYLFVETDKPTNKGAMFTQEMKRLLSANNISYSTFDASSDSLETLKTLLGNQSTLVIYGSSSIDDMLPVLNEVKQLNLPMVYQWGYEEWRNTLQRYPRTYYYSLFHATPTEEYQNQYERWFGRLRKVEVPRYDMLGYDLTYYFLHGIAKNNDSWFFVKPNVNWQLMQSEPNYIQVNDGLWMNVNHYLFYFDGYETQKVQ